MSFIIPTTEKVFSITNKSDVGGNIWYTKNITFDKKGYIKLSTRTASLQSELEDSDFDIPVFHRQVFLVYKILTLVLLLVIL